jgi:uncharacterized repeat protein (TIGR01451 family)
MWKKFSIYKKATIVGAAAFVAVAAGAVGLGSQSIQAADCTGNSILKCGTSSAADFISKVKSGNGGTQTDLDNIFASSRYKLTSADYSRFASYAKNGTAYRDGRVVVDGRVVGTNGQSLGRYAKTYSHPVTIDGKTYHEQSASRWLSDVPKPVLVLFNTKGQVQTIVMKECGNPISVTPNNPTYSCNMLNQTQVSRDTFRYTTSASAANGASINKVVYSFSDGTSVTKTSPTDPVTKTFPSAGTFTAKVTVYVNVPGSQVYAIQPAGSCVRTVTIAQAPVAACTYLKALATADRTKFTLNAAASAQNGATIQGYDFVVKNSAGTTVANPSVNTTATTATTSVTLTEAGTYTASVSVRTSLGVKTADACKTTIVVKPVEVPKVPGVSIDKKVDGVESKQVAVNQNFVYGVVVKNTGEVKLTNVVVRDPAPANVTMVSADKGEITNNVWTYTIPALEVGQSMTFNITAKVVKQVEGNIVNTACVNAPEVNPNEPTKDDDCDDATVNVPPVVPKNPNVSIVKTVDGVESKEVAVGQNFTYELVVKNTGEVDMKNVAVSDKAPAGVTLLSSDKGTMSANGDTWSYTIPELKIGDSLTVKLTAKVDAYVSGGLVNTACVNAVEVNPEEPTKDDACDTATVTVTPPPVVPPVTPEVPTTPEVLPETGAGSVVSIFAIVTAAGVIAHRAFLRAKLN